MTVIVASLFLPYTVKFEVGSDELPCAPERPVPRSNLSSSTPHSIIPSSIAQSNANSASATPVGSFNSNDTAIPPPISTNPFIHPGIGARKPSSGDGVPQMSSSLQNHLNRPGIGGRKVSFNDAGSMSDSSSINTAEDFFYKSNRRRITNPGTPDLAANSPGTFGENVATGGQLIQPRPRVVNQPKSTVVDKKRDDSGDLGLPSLKMNRSSNNLSSLNASAANSSTNLSALGGSALSSALSSGRGSFGSGLNLKKAGTGAGFTLNHNSSVSSLVEHPEEDSAVDVSFEDGVKEIDADDWSNNFNDMIHGRAATKLAPFGGFSKPDIENDILSGENIFDTAPWKVVYTDKGNVSLTKAVTLSHDAGIIKNRKWVGTIAMPSDSVSSKVIGDIGKTLSKDYNSEAVFPDDETFQGHYKSFCKQILWPTLHYQVPDDPKSKAFEAHSWDQYKLLNQIIADKVVEVYKSENPEDSTDPEDPDNMIWVHDYHLLLVPQMIRDKLPNVKIGFFLHVSFPSSEIFRVFAERKELLQGMLGANCVSMQTDEYVRHFLQTCSRLLLADTNEIGISYNGRYTVVNTIPVGIDVPSLQALLSGEEVLDWRQMIRERWGGQRLLVSRDKLDRLRGVKQKLLAYERLLKDNPEYVDNTVLIQICIGSVQDSDYEAEIMQIVSRINSLPENISVSQPVIFLQQDIEFEQYLALQCESDLFVVSSMREGLNLTCHEFIVATQEKKSPLVLSEFTGSSPLLECNGKGALMINPWDVKNLSETLKLSINMSAAEKKERWQNCYDIVLEHDSKNWVKNCLESINSAWEYDQSRSSTNIKPFTRDVLQDFYKNKSGKRLIFLNLETPSAISAIYDTSSSSGKTPAAGKTDSFSEPSRIASLLNELLSDPLNHIYLISFLKRSDLDILYRTNSRLGLIAENGGYIKLIGSKNWVSLGDEDELKSWMPEVKKLIESKVERLPGSHIEVEDCTIRFHPGRAFLDDHERSLDVMGDCIQHINDVYQESEGIHATLIRNVVIVQQNQLTLKALKFVLGYYNHSPIPEDFKLKKVSSGSASVPISQSNSATSIASFDKSQDTGDHIKSLFIAGGSTLIDEPGFEYANDLRVKGDIENVLTVAVIGSDTNVRTSATYGVLGKNVLLRVLSQVDK